MSKNFIRGDRVIARNDFLGYYYPGRITKVVDSKHSNIEFENGTVQKKLSHKHIMKLFDVQAYFTLGDYVLASVVNEYEQICWVPGIIQSIEDYTYPKVYSVLYFNGQENENIKLEMVKVSKNTYGRIVENIRSRLGLNLRSRSKTNLRAVHDIEIPDSPLPPRAETPADLGEIKKEIVEQIKTHLDSLKLDDKYDQIHDEFSNLKENHQELKNQLGGRLRVLKNDFDEFKNQEPKVVQIRSHKISQKSKPQASMNLEQKIIKLRTDLPHLDEDDSVLAKWPDNGWYYHAHVDKYLGDYKYLISGNSREKREIYREDIIQTNLNDIHSFQLGDSVLALHPHYELSYAPGQVVLTQNDKSKVTVRFYDYIESVMSSEDVFKLHILKFQTDIDNINYMESKWIGQSVLARNNETGIYQPGKIVGRVGNTGRQFIIKWKNDEETLQNFNHILGNETRNPSLVANEFVFSLRDGIFFPGRIYGRKGDRLIIKYFDDIIDENVSHNDCYWISKSYYKEASGFYKNNKNPIDLNSGRQDRNTPVIDAKQFYSGKRSYR